VGIKYVQTPGYVQPGYVQEIKGWFEDNLLRFLPAEYLAQDVTGDLESYLEVVTFTLDEMDELVTKFVEIFDVEKCEAQYLPLIAKTLGYPLDERDREEDQRQQLRRAVDWYRRKGLHESFRILFYSLGYIANLIELWTEDYVTFKRYPGTWIPSVFAATAYGTTAGTLGITNATRNLRVSIDGSQPITISLTVGEGLDTNAVAAEIDAEINQVGGDCFVDSGTLVIKSRVSGESSFVSITQSDNSAHTVLGFSLGTFRGIDYTIPDDLDILLENGGKWYKTPHFGIEIFSIKDYVRDADEVEYLRGRLELVRPVHTVLEFLTYLKSVADAFNVREDDLIGVLTPEIAEIWPFPVCMRRNVSVVYIRDGTVPDRSPANAEYFGHNRKGIDNAYRRGEFVYQYPLLTRGDPAGPPEMPNRGEARFYRDGIPIGEPNRISCEKASEILEMDLTYAPDEPWAMSHLRRNGFILRDQEDTYYRDGTFSRFYTRNNGWIKRGGGVPVGLYDLIDDWSVYASEQGGGGSFDGVSETTGHIYVQIPIPGGYYKLTSSTVLEFDFEGVIEGEVHAIGLDNDDAVNLPVMIYQLWGTDPGTLVGGTADETYNNYFPAMGVRHYMVTIGADFPNQWASRLVLIQDDQAADDAVSRFTNVQIRERGVEYLDHDQILDRSGENPPAESTDLLFERPDLPGIWFPTLAAMNDPAVLDLPDLPGPDP